MLRDVPFSSYPRPNVFESCGTVSAMAERKCLYFFSNILTRGRGSPICTGHYTSAHFLVCLIGPFFHSYRTPGFSGSQRRMFADCCSRFLQAGCPSCHPTTSVKPLKTLTQQLTILEAKSSMTMMMMMRMMMMMMMMMDHLPLHSWCVSPRLHNQCTGRGVVS